MRTHGTPLIGLAAACWGLAGGIGGGLMARGWGPFVTSFYRGAVGFVCLFLWWLARPKRALVSKRRLWTGSVLAGLGMAGNITFYFVSIREGGVAVAVTLMYCAPVYVLLGAWLTGQETLTLRKAGSIGLMLAGLVLLTGIYDKDSFSSLGVGAGLLSGMCYAVFLFSFKAEMASHGRMSSVLTIAFAVYTAVLFLLSDVAEIRAAVTSDDWPGFLALGLLGAGLSFVLYLIGLKHAPPTTASMVAVVEPLTAAMFGVLVLHERLTVIQITGMALVLLAVTALNVHGHARTTQV